MNHLAHPITLESLESRALFAAALTLTADAGKLVRLVSTPGANAGTLKVTVRNTGDAAVAKTQAPLDLDVTLVASRSTSSVTTAAVTPLVVQFVQGFKVNGLGVNKTKTLSVKVKVPEYAQARTYDVVVTADPTGTLVGSATLSVVAPATVPATLTVNPTPANIQALGLVALSTPDASGNANVSLRNNSAKPISAVVPIRFYAGVPGTGSSQTVSVLGTTTRAAGLFDAGSARVVVRKLAPGATVALPVVVTLPASLPAANTPFNFEVTASISSQVDFDPLVFTRTSLGRAASTSTFASSPTTLPDGQLGNQLTTLALTGPLTATQLGSTRPTTALGFEYGLFLDATGKQGLFITSRSFDGGTTTTTLYPSAA